MYIYNLYYVKNMFSVVPLDLVLNRLVTHQAPKWKFQNPKMEVLYQAVPYGCGSKWKTINGTTDVNV